MTSLTDLFSEITHLQVRDSIHTFASVLGLKPATWKVGEFELECTTAVSMEVAKWWNTYIRLAIRGGFVDYAERGWLTVRGQDVKVERIPASFAVGKWTGTNATAGVLGPYAANDLVFFKATTGKTYRNTAPVTFAVGANAPIEIKAVEIGSGSDAAPGQITLQTVVQGLTGTNAETVLGRDEETDDALRTRIRLKPASLSPNGPRGAYEYVCRTPTDPLGKWNHGVDVNRTWVSPYSTASLVSVLIAGPAGAVDAPGVALVNTAVQQNVVPDGVTATVTSATAVVVPVTYTVYVRASGGVLAATTSAAIGVALARYFKTAPIGGDKLPPATGELDPGFIFQNRIESVIARAAEYLEGSAPVQEVVQVVVSAPVGNVTLLSGQVPALGTITATVVAV